MHPQSDEFDGPGPHLRVLVPLQESDAPGQQRETVREAGRRVRLAPVAGQRVHGRDPHPRVGVVEPGGQVVHGVPDEQLVQQLAALFAHQRVGVVEPLADRGHGGCSTPEQLTEGSGTAFPPGGTALVRRAWDCPPILGVPHSQGKVRP